MDVLCAVVMANEGPAEVGNGIRSCREREKRASPYILGDIQKSPGKYALADYVDKLQITPKLQRNSTSPNQNGDVHGSIYTRTLTDKHITPLLFIPKLSELGQHQPELFLFRSPRSL